MFFYLKHLKNPISDPFLYTLLLFYKVVINTPLLIKS